MKTRQTSRLVEIELALDDVQIPAPVAALLSDANQQVELLEDNSRAAIPAFVPSDFELVYRALSGIQAANLATGRRFLEWGSGIGVVACLATQLGFDSIGIEIEQPLVEIAESLATSHRLETQFACGSFLPSGAEIHLNTPDDFAWLSTIGATAYDDLDLQPDDFDVVFAYPWPGEEQILFNLFTDYAATGALLLTYHGLEGLRLQRKTSR